MFFHSSVVFALFWTLFVDFSLSIDCWLKAKINRKSRYKRLSENDDARSSSPTFPYRRQMTFDSFTTVLFANVFRPLLASFLVTILYASNVPRSFSLFTSSFFSFVVYFYRLIWIRFDNVQMTENKFFCFSLFVVRFRLFRLFLCFAIYLMHVFAIRSLLFVSRNFLLVFFSSVEFDRR